MSVSTAVITCASAGRTRLEMLFDDGEYDAASSLPKTARDPLKFRDRKRYAERLKEAQGKTGEKDAIVVAHGKLGGERRGDCRYSTFDFMGGSMGVAVGEAPWSRPREWRSMQEGVLDRRSASGGARMQEGILSLMQMPRTVIAVQEVRGSGAALYRVADRSDHGRRFRLLRHAGRRPYRRTRRDDRFRRRPRDRADRARNPAGGLPDAPSICWSTAWWIWSPSAGAARYAGARRPTAAHPPRRKSSPCRGTKTTKSRMSEPVGASDTPGDAGYRGAQTHHCGRRDRHEPMSLLERLLDLHPKKIDLSLDRVLHLLDAARTSARETAAGGPCGGDQRQRVQHRLHARYAGSRRLPGACLYIAAPCTL